MLFGKFGNVEEAEIIFNGKGSKGFGFVTMSRGQDADNALNMLNNAIVEGRVLEVIIVLLQFDLAVPICSLFRSMLLCPRDPRSRPEDLQLQQEPPPLTEPQHLSL